ncbi:hypothetical protein D1B31_16355 [Neobacillus notoginsengisoli]|uniref:Uncharacterized protein n=1 Tax=Neobacillus notoginsengisoli TaxID=1578198 RepID=A0A417YR60_9BACI|nr:hypothetical protein [Neobacillus notoginsengisoli]RHW37335.1 hypothetical protein D1B31_16355 [Neobacillus notoginsengisoli]
MSKNKVVKPVSFNKTNEQDVKLMAFLKGKNFSGYVKELITVDMQRKESSLKIVERTKEGGVKIVLGR